MYLTYFSTKSKYPFKMYKLFQNDSTIKGVKGYSFHVPSHSRHVHSHLVTSSFANTNSLINQLVEPIDK